MSMTREAVAEQTDMRIFGGRTSERRAHRRHDLESRGLTIDRWDGKKRSGKILGQLVDISAGGVKVRLDHPEEIRPDQQIRIRLELPAYAGISPFVDTSKGHVEPKREWVGWLAVSRVNKVNEVLTEVAGRLVDMEEMDRGMLGLYLSTQPLAA